jgi:hypothetical protein
MGNVVRAAAHDHGAASSEFAPLDWAANPFAGAPHPEARWLCPGAHTIVGGHAIPGGMIYLGQRLVAARGGRTEPSLIDPELEVDSWCPEVEDSDLGYWPSYDRIAPASRAAYLHWLAEGRRTPGVPIGFVCLFFYGLERRLLHDILPDETLRAEVPALAAEVRGLLEVYGSHASFRRYATEFAHLLELVGAPDQTPAEEFAVPDLLERRWPPPMTLRRALGAFASEGRPLPPAWALAWAWYHPDISLRTPAFRCRDEFARLFTLRYTNACGEGPLVEPGPRRLCVEYQPASAGLRPTRYARDVPDVYLADGPRRRLAALVAGVTEDLAAYSRWVRRHRDQRDSLATAALLPTELVVDGEGRACDPEVAVLQDWAERRLAGASSATVDVGELVASWPTATVGVMTRREAAALCRLLGHVGIGLEPDVRMGGTVPAVGEQAVVFRVGSDASAVASEDYTAAVTFAQLATAVLATSCQLAGRQRRQVCDLACAALPLTAGERTRLAAHLDWLATSAQSRLTLARRRLDGLSDARRVKIGELLVTTATAGGTVLPHHVTSLLTSYRRLGLDPDAVPNRLHASLTTPAMPPSRTSTPAPAGKPLRVPTPPPAQASGPVTVQAGGAVGEYVLPPPPAEPSVPGSGRPGDPSPVVISAPDSAGARGPDSDVGRDATPDSRRPDSLVPNSLTRVPLDTATIEAKLVETATVSTLLHSIFADDEAPAGRAPGDHATDGGDAPHTPAHEAAHGAPPENAGTRGGAPDVPDLVPGLDAAHSALVRALAQQPTWPRDAFETLAADLGLLPAGALDLLNEAALDLADDLLTTGDDVLEIDDGVLQELLA